MARKIFVSYKHHDSSVKPLKQFGATTTRDYVDLLEQYFEGDHIYKGEKDGEDFGAFKDETTESHLRDKIFDSSITIVLISKKMKEFGISEDEQWIPWEISYSLREKNREDKTSTTNAMLAVIVPDEIGSYSYMVNHYPCVTQWNTASLFKVLGINMFNRNKKNLILCTNCGNHHHTGNDHSYIHPVKWDNFISDINGYIDLATQLNENIDEYDIKKEMQPS